VQSARGDDIDRSHASDLPTFMNRRLGSVYVNEIQNNPFQPDVSFRGFTASPLLGTPQGLSVYLDGVRMNQPFGDVVSWDLIPRVAISSITLMPGSNPLFGLNTLGGAISLVTKDGVANPGSSLQLRGGSHGLVEAEFESGGSQASGLDWYAAGDRYHSRGWRDASPTDIGQLFGKLGWRDIDTRLSLSASLADNDMTGNGLQEQRLLARDRASIYTLPDTTRNRSLTLNLQGTHRRGDALTFSGNAYYRNIRSETLNGDVNDESLDQQIYQPNAAEQHALAAAGYIGADQRRQRRQYCSNALHRQCAVER
jgi:outer membrane cobalamin receptor